MKQRIPVLAAAICVSGLLIIPVWPRFVGGAIVAPYEDTLRDIARGKKLSPRLLAETETALRVAGKWSKRGENFTNLGSLRLVAAREAVSAADQRAALDQAITELSDGLMREPANAYAWLQLGQVVRARRGAIPAIEKYLGISTRLARWEHRLVMPRLEIALGIWPVLGSSYKATLPRQFERAVDTAPVALARAVRRNYALRQARQMLALSPLHLDRFQLVYLSPD
ncbi:MAG: hypothetical protein ACI9JL_004046 [Paracoccaceae bacterium]|jgi:hypothetical protein